MIKMTLLLLFLMAPMAQAATPNPNRATLDVLTYNVWMIPVQGKLAAKRSALIGNYIRRYDLVFLQEAFRKNLRKKIKSSSSKKFKDLYHYQRGNILGNGLYNLSKFSITRSKFMLFKDCEGIHCAASKGVLYMQIKLPNGMLIDTFNTHLQSFEKNHAIRVKQLAQTKRFIDNINDGTLPVMFVGDFNIIASVQEYGIFENYLVNYKDAWLDFRPSDDGFTWNPDVNTWAYYDENESVQLQRLDYIFIRDGKKLKWNVLDIKLAFNKRFQAFTKFIYVSDHFGVHSSLELSLKE